MDAEGIAIVSIPSGEISRVSPVRGPAGVPFDWSPDGSRFVFATGDAVVTVSAADGSTKTVARVTPSVVPGCSESVAGAQWSPDGRWIAYEEIRCVQEAVSFLHSSIPIITPDGVWKNEFDNSFWGQSIDFGPHSFVWSPDSRYLAFVDDAEYSVGEDYLEIAAMSPRGGYKRLTTSAANYSPAWQRSVP